MPVDWSRYPDHWPEMRAAAMEAAGFRCQGCGAEDGEDGTNGSTLTCHHPDRDPEYHRARLTVLCARCHLAVESIARKRQRRLAGIPLGHVDGQMALDPEEDDPDAATRPRGPRPVAGRPARPAFLR